jgi:hypothetical protein
VGDHWNLNVEQWGANGLAEQVLVALVVRVGNKGDTGRKKFWASGLDVDDATLDKGWVGVETNAVVSTWLLAVFKLCLGNRGAEGNVPESWSHRLVGLAASQVV